MQRRIFCVQHRNAENVQLKLVRVHLQRIKALLQLSALRKRFSVHVPACYRDCDRLARHGRHRRIDFPHRVFHPQRNIDTQFPHLPRERAHHLSMREDLHLRHHVRRQVLLVLSSVHRVGILRCSELCTHVLERARELFLASRHLLAALVRLRVLALRRQ